MGTIYLAVCETCKMYIDLDKYRGWPGCMTAINFADITEEDISEFRDNNWLYRTMRLHLFLFTHNGHEIYILSEDEFTYGQEYIEQFKWPEKVKVSLKERAFNKWPK